MNVTGGKKICEFCGRHIWKVPKVCYGEFAARKEVVERSLQSAPHLPVEFVKFPAYLNHCATLQCESHRGTKVQSWKMKMRPISNCSSHELRTSLPERDLLSRGG